MITIKCLTDENIELNLTTLKGADLSGLNLHRALLENENLSGAIIVGANLRCAELESID